MEIFHIGDTGPPIDFLLKRDGTVVDPSAATEITVKVRIKGRSTVKFTKTKSGGGVSVVTDADGNKRVRVGPFGASDFDTEGVYQAQPVITWSSNTETVPEPYEFKVVAAWG